MLTVIDYKMNNLGSILNMLKKVGAQDICVATEPAHLKKATKIIMPGIGAFDAAAKKLKETGLWDAIQEKAHEKIPFLGICLGMQLMLDSSEEGDLAGLSLIPGRCRKFSFEPSSALRIPHMGWNQARMEKPSRLLPEGEKLRFYFVHSYYVECDRPTDVLTSTEHGKTFVSAFEHENLIGVQFHPEKSHNYGLNLFQNFLEKY